jgi:hypothetical protein
MTRARLQTNLMTRPFLTRQDTGRSLLGIGALCLALMLGGCGGDDSTTPSTPATPGTPSGTTPAACTTSHCAPAP